MPDYKEMYRVLLGEMMEAVSILHKAQIRIEELYGAEDDANKLVLIKSDKKDCREKETRQALQE